MSPPIALTGGQLIDGTGRAPVHNALVLVEGDRITYAGPAGERRIPDSAQILDIQGKSVLPGLFDCHLHSAPSTPQDLKYANSHPAFSVLLAARYMKDTLRAGVTTVRDVGAFHDGVISLRNAINEGLVLGPRMLVSVRALCITGGHAHHSGTAVEADGADGVRQEARRQLRSGADFIKIMATAGVGTPGWRGHETQFTVEEIRAAVDAADRAGKYVAAHAHAEQGIRDCVESGVRSIEHGSGMSQATAALMTERGAYLVPTIQVYHFMVTTGKQLGLPQWKLDNGQRRLDNALKNLQNAVKEGVTFCLGTDNGFHYVTHGEVVTEMNLLKQTGLSTMEVLQSATLRSAELCLMDDRLGSVETGKIADVIVVNGDPMHDFECIRSPHIVLKEGEVVSRTD